MAQLDWGVIKKALLEGSYVTESDLANAEEYAAKHATSLFDYFLINNKLSQDIIGQVMSEAYGIPFVRTQSVPVSDEELVLPNDLAHNLRAVIYQISNGEIVVATDTPQQEGLLKTLQNVLPDYQIRIAYATSDDINERLREYDKKTAANFSDVFASDADVVPQIVEKIIDAALINNASDIHIEPRANEIMVRLRIDGILQDFVKVESTYHEKILNRIKILADLQIDEHNVPLDGAIRYLTDDGREIDIRISIVSGIRGEKIVMRILSQYVKKITLLDLGYIESQRGVIEEAANKPFGMVLVSGPTGSGKTTTLYSLLKMRISQDVNITTIEDPVEYKIDNITQIPVKPDIGLTFARGLRAIVRQDPDIVLVGEIRDTETAEISINAALTGHLLFSTFHANDAASTIPRLLNMGIEPFLLSSTLELIIAQRLVRKICAACRYSYKESTEALRKQFDNVYDFGTQETITLYRGKGCRACAHTGYAGRSVIAELLPIDNTLRHMILSRPSAQEIEQYMQSQHMETLFTNGLQKVDIGVTTIEEVFRVAMPN